MKTRKRFIVALFVTLIITGIIEEYNEECSQCIYTPLSQNTQILAT